MNALRELPAHTSAAQYDMALYLTCHSPADILTISRMAVFEGDCCLLFVVCSYIDNLFVCCY
jgi:hypothetical protein